MTTQYGSIENEDPENEDPKTEDLRKRRPPTKTKTLLFFCRKRNNTQTAVTLIKVLQHALFFCRYYRFLFRFNFSEKRIINKNVTKYKFCSRKKERNSKKTFSCWSPFSFD